MKKHAIIPIFIPHRGCGHSCVFCNQKAITARTDDVTPEDVRRILDTWLSTMQRLDTIEAAFYGGSFTGLPMEEQAAFLAVTKEYKDLGKIDKIHLSTRPDYIDGPILDQLRACDVDIIELGVQSFDQEVLTLSRRGHTVEDIYRACDLIQSYGFELGIQLMIGLPGDSLEKCIDSARKTVQIGPSLARLYPTIVLEDTELARQYAAGLYHPLTTGEAVAITKEMYRILDDAGITILRVGLKSTDLISETSENSRTFGHSFHPAFRQLVEGELAREDLEDQLQRVLDGSTTEVGGATEVGSTVPAESLGPAGRLTFSSCGESFSNMIGHGGANRKYFADKYPQLQIRFAVDPALPRGTYRVSR
ncbi:MAG: radical SAM protein [Firmicutes bacterium]|nr:radical SAM protein [Bacillota bacterium]